MNVLRASVSSVVFAAVLAGEISIVARHVPRDALTIENFNVFMLLSMGMAFIPLLLALALGAAFVAVLVAIAYLAAWVCWSLLSPRLQMADSPRMRMLKRIEELKRTKPERERITRFTERDQ